MKILSFSLNVVKAFATALVLILLSPDGHAQSKLAIVKGYGKASYSVSDKMVFMREWLVAGPVVMDDPNRDEEKFFNSDTPEVDLDPAGNQFILRLASSNLQWAAHSSETDLIDFDKLYKKDYASAYALAELRADGDQSVVLGLGSDDAVKVWLNGKLIHKNWIARGAEADDDMVILPLKKGSNRLLIKVQDRQQGWGFIARILDSNAAAAGLISAIAKGDVEQCKALLDGGADPNLKNSIGLTPLGAARLYGRPELENLLAQRGATDTSIPSGEALTDSRYASLQGKKAPGIALLVAKDGKVLYSKGFGFADVGGNEPITPRTKFRIGSITKQFIAAAILKLQEEGKISVNDKLSKFIPDFPRGETITIHHLLTHTSGIHSYTARPDFVSRVASKISEEELVAIIKADEFDFNPGDQYRYNNSGYFLLGHIIRVVTGKSYGDYLQKAFFQPLGMNSTGVHSANVKLTQEAKGYSKENGAYNLALNWDMSWAGGAGALYSTVEDLYLWNEAVFNNKVLKPQSMNAAFTPVRLSNGQLPPEGNYGYGWGMQTFREAEVIGHGGGLHGFSTRIARLPAHNLTVVMLTNLVPTEVLLEPTTIAEYFVWDKLAAAKTNVEATVQEDRRPYEGRYDFTNGVVMVVSLESDQLYAQLTGQQRFPIFPSAPGSYFWKVVNAKVDFVKNDKGEVTHGDFSQNGMRLKVTKMADIKVAALDPAVYDDYVGKYDYGNNFHITIMKENGKLFAQGTNQPRFEIVPVSDSEFAAREVNARLVFVKDKPGKASKLVLDMAGQKKDALRIE